MNTGCAVHNCNRIVVQDTATWQRPLCNLHFDILGAPCNEPNWELVIEMCKTQPRVFDFRKVKQPTGA